MAYAPRLPPEIWTVVGEKVVLFLVPNWAIVVDWSSQGAFGKITSLPWRTGEALSHFCSSALINPP